MYTSFVYFSLFCTRNCALNFLCFANDSQWCCKKHSRMGISRIWFPYTCKGHFCTQILFFLWQTSSTHTPPPPPPLPPAPRTTRYDNNNKYHFVPLQTSSLEREGGREGRGVMLPDIEGADKSDYQDANPSNATSTGSASKARESARSKVANRMLRITVFTYIPGLASAYCCFYFLYSICSTCMNMRTHGTNYS